MTLVEVVICYHVANMFLVASNPNPLKIDKQPVLLLLMPTLDWIGKDKIINHHKSIPYCTLERKYSFDKDGQHEEDNGSENMIIHGDNLYALKALLPMYEGKIKCIYIDPPYNTGNKDWCYNDNVDHPLFKKWLEETLNAKESERYVHADDLSRHDKWLCMMYPRLVLLQRLLDEDGAIFISINDIEVSNLRLVCDEIFGSSNFITIAPKKGSGGRQDSKQFAIVHEYVVIYAKNISFYHAGRMPKESKSTKIDPDSGKLYSTQLLRKWGDNSRRVDRPNLYYPIYYNPSTKDLSVEPRSDYVEIYPMLSSSQEGRWRWAKDSMQSNMDEGKVEVCLDKSGNWVPYERVYDDKKSKDKPYSTWIDQSFESGTTELKEIIDNHEFPYPKSSEYVAHLISMCTSDKNCIVLDSFAGSGTTAHAVMNLNRLDGGHRKFIEIEMMDYAEPVTATRLKNLIKMHYSDISFSFYELGPQFKLDNEINNDISLDQIKQFIMYTETKQPYLKLESSNPSLIGRFGDTAYYLLFGNGLPTILDCSFIPVLEMDCSSHVVYADACYISDEILDENNIRFKKIPRDIRGC